MVIRIAGMLLVLALASACATRPAVEGAPPAAEASATSDAEAPAETAPRQREFPRRAALAVGIGAAGAFLLYAGLIGVGMSTILASG